MHNERRWENQPAVGWPVDDLDVAEIRNTVAEAVRIGRLNEPGSREPEDLLRGVVMDLDPWSDREDLVEDVATAFLGSLWCEKDYGTPKDDDVLRYGWKRFSDLIKHHTRHLFFDAGPNKSIHDEGIPPSRMLVALGTLAND